MKTEDFDNRMESMTGEHFCPVCNAELNSPQYAFVRYPHHVCRTCSPKTADRNGRSLRFFNPYPLGHGCAAKYTDTGEDYSSDTCYINGMECSAGEARFGGIVIQAVRNSTEIINSASRIRHSLFGFVLGDCLGVPYEFQEQGTFRFKPFAGNGVHGQKPCTWSDDTALTLAMLNSTVEGEYCETVHKNSLKRFLEGEYFPDGRCFDAGNATRRAITCDFTCSTDNSFGNGGLLRIWTLAALSFRQRWTDEKEREVMRQACGLTHSTQELYMTCCELYFDMLKSLYRGEKDLERYRLRYAEIYRRPDFKRYEMTGGHICNATSGVMDTFFKFTGYGDIMEPMCHIIEKGYDTDSNAALLGALLGAEKAIPEKYLNKIRGIERIPLHLCCF